MSSRWCMDSLQMWNGVFDLPESVEKMILSSHRPHEVGGKGAGDIPVDILERPKEYVFLMDVPGISKSDIQVMVEDERTLVVKTCKGKRKREEEEEECKYIRLERRRSTTTTGIKLMRKFRLPEDANTGGVTAKCENGVLMVTVEKMPPPDAKTKMVEVTIA